MSTYDDASLILYPSGYKASKLYSLKPTNGTGDLDVVRATTATRVNSAGLIEKVRTNLFLQSQTFDNASWDKTSCVVTANAATAPDGTLTAEKIVIDNGVLPTDGFDTGLLQRFAVTTGTYTYSVFAKAAEFNILRFRERISIGNFFEFNLSTGTFDAPSNQFRNPTMEAVGNGWYRCSFVTQDNTANVNKYALRVGGTGDGTSGIFIWGAQFEATDFGATDYIPTTTAAVSVGMLANIPRIDYTGGGCGKLLLEPQRTNAITFSESFDNAAWTKSAIATTITANSSTSPSGFQDADTWTINAAGARFVGQTKTVTAGAVTASFFVKKGTSDFFYLRIADGATFAGFTFNVATGTLGQSNSLTLVPIPSIEDYGNGWYRCSVTTTVVGTSIDIQGFVATSASVISGLLNASLICWGAMLEVGSYATSYIPTLGAAVTRGADAASKTGISSLIGQTQGTLYLEFNGISNPNASRISLSDGSSNNWVFIALEGNKVRGFVRSNATTVFSDETTNPTSNNKVALAYQSGSIALYINGVQILIDSPTFTFTSPLAEFGSLVGVSNTVDDPIAISQSIVFPTRLSNTQLAELTTL